jgi:dihydroorotate dehydrogenase electron transfer subunit
MACGIGICMTCVLPVRGTDGVTRMLRACTDGPVLDASTVRWDCVGAHGASVPADALGAPPGGAA